MTKILIIEDDPQISKSLRINLKLSGHEVHTASTIEEGWGAISSSHFDVIFLDVGLPDGSGLDLCEKIRLSGNDVPILFMSALTDEKTVVKGMNLGGDDYLRKPFGIEELKARLNKVIRKFSPATSAIKFGQITIDPMKRAVKIMDQAVSLGKKELEILCLLTRKAGDIVSRETILNTLYEGSDLYDRTVDSHISHLRKKIKEVAGTSITITSVYGMGYKLEIN